MLARLTYDMHAWETCQKFAANKRLGFGLGERPESGAATNALQLGRAFGGDGSEAFHLPTDDGDAASDAMHKGTIDHAGIGVLIIQAKFFDRKVTPVTFFAVSTMASFFRRHSAV